VSVDNKYYLTKTVLGNNIFLQLRFSFYIIQYCAQLTWTNFNIIELSC
jgi:hypothetical protein